MPATPTATATAIKLQAEARDDLKKALRSRQLTKGRVAYPAPDADRIVEVIRRLRPASPDESSTPQRRLLRATIGSSVAVDELEKFTDLPSPAAGHVERALKHARGALALREAVLEKAAKAKAEKAKAAQ